MSKLNVDQKTIKDLFQSKKSDFLIPDYQRPYAWGEAECRTLCDDIFSFAIPDEGKTEFPFTLGQNQYDFIDYPDFCAQVAAVVGQKNEQGIINICSGKPEKLADRVERFIKENGYRIKLQYGAFPDRPYDSKAIWGNDTKIRKIMENQTN